MSPLPQRHTVLIRAVGSTLTPLRIGLRPMQLVFSPFFSLPLFGVFLAEENLGPRVHPPLRGGCPGAISKSLGVPRMGPPLRGVPLRGPTESFPYLSCLDRLPGLFVPGKLEVLG